MLASLQIQACQSTMHLVEGAREVSTKEVQGSPLFFTVHFLSDKTEGERKEDLLPRMSSARYSSLMHMVDVLPTVLSAAGVESFIPLGLDLVS